MKPISENAVSVNRIRVTAVMFFITFLFGGLSVFFPISALIAETIIFILYIFCMTEFLKKWQRTYFYQADENRIRIKKGVLISKDITIFRYKLQYTKLVRTPAELLFHTCTIIYYTAGSVVYLSGIDSEAADGALIYEKKI